MKNLNKIKIAPDMEYEIGQEKKSWFPKWDVKDDATLYDKVVELAHSAFDLSKFTVVGSPIVKSEGVAISLNNNNCLQIPFDNSLTNFKVSIKNIIPSAAGNVIYGVFGLVMNNSGISVTGSEVTGSPYIITFVRQGATQYNKSYDFYLEKNGTTYTAGVKLSTETTYSTKTETYATALTGSFLQLGYTTAAPSNFDLKNIEITVDGVTVFSGNKTGIDTIKTDDYTVVGTPTISADGIASGFSNNDYLSAPSIDLTSAKEVIIESEIIVPTVAPESEIGAATAVRCGLMSVGARYRTNGVYCAAFIPSAYSTRRGQIDLPYDGSTYIIQGVFTDLDTETPKYYCRSRKKDNPTWTQTDAVENRPQISGQTNADINIGIFNPAGTKNTFTIGKINLNNCKIYVDGSLVYQACLKIPYTEGQNYSKIVDMQYRDRVKDLFEQVGYTGYYTLSKNDFTLPSHKWSDIVKYYENGISKWEQRADLSLYQQGNCTSGTEVTLSKPFKDTNYILSVPYSAKTSAKFTPSASGYWFAKGKCYL